jgi:hypothetical protein
VPWGLPGLTLARIACHLSGDQFAHGPAPLFRKVRRPASSLWLLFPSLQGSKASLKMCSGPGSLTQPDRSRAFVSSPLGPNVLAPLEAPFLPYGFIPYLLGPYIETTE